VYEANTATVEEASNETRTMCTVILNVVKGKLQLSIVLLDIQPKLSEEPTLPMRGDKYKSCTVPELLEEIM
jgi:hypothetical protein